MVQNNNTIPTLFPAFNKNLLEVESVDFTKEKHNYITDILTDKTVHENVVIGSVLGFNSPAIFGGVGTLAYTVGDYVLVRTVTGAFDYSGIFRVVLVPNDGALIIDGAYLGDVIGGEVEVFRIFRNKLPASPDGTATFNLNGYATGLVSEDFALDNVGIFNVPNSFDRFSFLSSEEYYQNLSFDAVQDNNGLAQLYNVSGEVSIGQTLQIIGNTTSAIYDGIYQVTSIDIDGFLQVLVTLNRPFLIPTLSTGTIITLPKVVVWYKDFNDISEDKIIFNGALPFPKILDFDVSDFDMSLFTNAKFLNSAPSLNKIKLNQRSYTQFYQSLNTTSTQFIIQVVDELGFQHEYIVQSQASPDNFLGIAVGTYDLNQIDASSFISVPARGLPIIQECDSSYCVSLYGEDSCDINGLQTTNFQHPYASLLNPSTWIQSNSDSLIIEVLNFDIGGIGQAIAPTGNIYNQATITGQSQEEKYSDEIGLQTSINIQSTLAFGSGYSSGHWIEVDQSQDFYLEVKIRLFGAQFLSGINLIIEYSWNSSTCTSSYRLKNGIGQIHGTGKGGRIPTYSQNLLGWNGLQSNPISPLDISTPICFELDYTPFAYKGVRVLFQDRFGSFVGFNFNLKCIRKLETSSDGFEVDRYQVEGVDSTTRGFKTIQFSYSEEWDLNSDFLSEEEVRFLEESFTSPNCWIEVEGEVLPCVVKPKTETIPSKENNDLRRFVLTVRVNGTDYSQRN